MDGSDRLDRVGAADGFHASFGETKVLDLAFSDQILDGACHVLDRHVGIHTMLIKEIDDVDLQPFQRGFSNLLDMLGPAVQPWSTCHASRVRRDIEAELCGDGHLISQWRKRFADEFFVRERPVDLGRVEECDAAFDSGSKKGDHLLFVRRGTIGKAHSHATEPQSGDFQIALAQLTFLHIAIS